MGLRKMSGSKPTLLQLKPQEENENRTSSKDIMASNSPNLKKDINPEIQASWRILAG